MRGWNSRAAGRAMGEARTEQNDSGKWLPKWLKINGGERRTLEGSRKLPRESRDSLSQSRYGKRLSKYAYVAVESPSYLTATSTREYLQTLASEKSISIRHC